MEMLVDPMLKQWVPAWLVEQYERANPFFREALTALVEHAREADPDWARRNTEERVSAAGAAQPAKDRQSGSVADSRMPKGGEARFGVLFNPKGYNWTDTDDQCNVHWREHDRLEGLRKEWYGKASVATVRWQSSAMSWMRGRSLLTTWSRRIAVLVRLR